MKDLFGSDDEAEPAETKKQSVIGYPKYPRMPTDGKVWNE